MKSQKKKKKKKFKFRKFRFNGTRFKFVAEKINILNLVTFLYFSRSPTGSMSWSAVLLVVGCLLVSLSYLFVLLYLLYMRSWGGKAK